MFKRFWPGVANFESDEEWEAEQERKRLIDAQYRKQAYEEDVRGKALNKKLNLHKLHGLRANLVKDRREFCENDVLETRDKIRELKAQVADQSERAAKPKIPRAATVAISILVLLFVVAIGAIVAGHVIANSMKKKKLSFDASS